MSGDGRGQGGIDALGLGAESMEMMVLGLKRDMKKSHIRIRA